MKFARAVACLFQDSHSVAIVHGGHTERAEIEEGETRAAKLCGTAMVQAETENRNLVATLSRAAIPALGICGADGGMCEIRRSHPAGGGDVMELANMNSRWVEVICGNRGVPVISNVALASGGEHCLLDADKLASACAKAWCADALIYLTSVDGVRDLDGSIIRWLDISYLDILKTKVAVAPDMLGSLRACREAIESNVGRVRILPLSHVDCLPSFFSSRIDVGTEVVALHGYSARVS
jgi:acetylglutamate kinase